MGCSVTRSEGPAWLPAIVEFLEQRPKPGDASGSADKDPLVDVPLDNTADAQAILERTRQAPEVVHAQPRRFIDDAEDARLRVPLMW
eukprot:6142927-Lingulodinium_polyedra.AAC.1